MVAVTHDGSSWEKARKMGILEANMLGAQLGAAADTWDEVFFNYECARRGKHRRVFLAVRKRGRNKEATDYAIGEYCTA